MKHFNSILASVLVCVGVLAAGSVSAQTTEPEWQGAAISSALTANGSVYLYNVGAKAFFVNGDTWGTRASLNIDYGMPFKSVSSEVDGKWRLETDLQTDQGTYLCYITESSVSSDIGQFFCDRTTSGNIDMLFEKVPNSQNNEYYINYKTNRNRTNNYMTADRIVGNSKKGTLTKTNAVNGDYSKWIIITSDEVNRHLEKNPADLNNPTNVTYLIKDPNLDRGSKNLAYWTLDEWNAIGDGLKLGTMELYKTAPDGEGESSCSGDKSNGYRSKWGKYFGAEARGVCGKFQQKVKVWHTGWYSVSCQGFYWNDGKANDVVSLFATVDGSTRKQKLSLANNEGDVPADWHAAALKLFPGTNYTNAVMFFVQMDNPNEKGYDKNGKEVIIGLNWDKETYSSDDWTVFDDFQLEFMGHNNNLILEENVLDYDYLLKTKEQYKNSTLLFNRMFTENAWNTLVLPVSLTKKQFLTAFGADARIASLKEVKDGILRFETIMKKDKTDDFVLLEAGRPYIVYIVKNPTVTNEYSASLNPIEGGDPIVKTIGGTSTGAYYEIPFVTLDKAKLNGVDSYVYEDGDASITFNGTLVKTYEGTTILPGFDDMDGKIIFKDGKLWWLTEKYGMKAYRGWLEPVGYAREEATGNAAKISFEIDGVEDDATYIHGIFSENESSVEKFANGVFSLNGMNMGTNSIDNLPKGIYIVNGKKYIVK